MKIGRKIISCSSCQKEKVHFGLGMCSACLRNYKRKTKPSFYLGTCYSEISRRCKTSDPLRPKYFGLEKVSKTDFINRFLNDREFLFLYEVWQKNGYQRKHAPSIDRINNTKGYTLDNMQFILQSINSTKDIQKRVRVYKDDILLGSFNSQSEASKSLGFSPACICRALKKNRLLNKRYRLERF